MALTQMQLIQSLGEAMAWFERELQWGVPPTELRHLCGRIGELYAALITNGQMAVAVNQQGYDVVSAEGERISVKTTAMMGAGGHITFNPRSLGEVDRVIVLRVNTAEMQVEILLDAPVAEALSLMAPDAAGKRLLSLSRLVKKPKPRSEIRTTSEVRFEGCVVRELESGTIEVEKDGVVATPALPALKELAGRLNVPLLNSNGNPLNTRQLGSQVIRTVSELHKAEVAAQGGELVSVDAQGVRQDTEIHADILNNPEADVALSRSAIARAIAGGMAEEAAAAAYGLRPSKDNQE